MPVRERVELVVVRMARTLKGIALKLAAAEPPPAGLADLDAQLVKTHRVLAENTPSDARRARYRLDLAKWYWRGARREGVSEEEQAAAAGLFRGALDEAREAKNRPIAAEAALWFKEQGLPVPPGELADGAGGD